MPASRAPSPSPPILPPPAFSSPPPVPLPARTVAAADVRPHRNRPLPLPLSSSGRSSMGRVTGMSRSSGGVALPRLAVPDLPSGESPAVAGLGRWTSQAVPSLPSLPAAPVPSSHVHSPPTEGAQRSSTILASAPPLTRQKAGRLDTLSDRDRGAGTGRGTGAESGSGTGPEEGTGSRLSYYLALLRQHIHQALEYPPAASRRGMTGTVHMEIVIRPDGAIDGVSVLESSSHRILDQAALDSVRKLPPLPFPAGFPSRTLRVRVPVVFELR
ncbi:MAG: energy transducer TonB [Candidatus Methylomirabilia bacterium]